jgi:trehalose 6-phosphate phosphatase
MKQTFQAAIIDLDGVVTRTATQHARAWKIMFDIYNETRKRVGGEAYREFTVRDDYPQYIDGIPRYDGVREFLSSREIELPYGHPDDTAGKETICGLGNLKNRIFLEVIKKEGVEIFKKNIQQIRKWKEQGLKTAVISSSKNCRQILDATGLTTLFDTRVDGITSVERNIKGKPAPDIFLEAARELGVQPAEALVAEDSLAGVAAGKEGMFGLVIGVDNGSGAKELRRRGADIVVSNLQEVELKTARKPRELPLAMENIRKIKASFKNRKPLIFLDFDGTLAPIVERYEDAAMSPEVKEVVNRLAEKYAIAVISGRGLKDVKERVGLKDIYYAGSHGFEISGPAGFHSEHDEAKKAIPVFDMLEPTLKEKLKDIKGVRFERKKFTLAVHYRQVTDEQQEEVKNTIEKTLGDHKEVKAGKGKKVIEIKPNLDWHKGRAVQMLIKELSDDKQPVMPLYIGDDITDEDAFRILYHGTGILVGDHGSETFADYLLDDVPQVKELLQALTDS